MKLLQKIALSSIRTRLRILSLISKEKAAKKAFELFCTPQVRVVKKMSPLFEQAETLTIGFRDYQIVGYRWNKGGSRKVLILHGFESSVINFEGYIRSLAEKGYEVLAFDAPAHGRSSGKRINALIYRDLIKHITVSFGPIQSFMAHSFGGLALCLALAETIHGNDSRVALIAPASTTISAIDHFFHFIRLPDRGVRNEFEKIILNLGGEGLSWFSIHRCLAQISAEILWVHDEEDTITPLKDVQIIQKENYPGIRFVITKGLGHRRIYRDTAVRKIITDFL